MSVTPSSMKIKQKIEQENRNKVTKKHKNRWMNEWMNEMNEKVYYLKLKETFINDNRNK